MAYEYGVNLKLDSQQAVKDIDAILGKLKQMETAAAKVKLKLNITDGNSSIEKQKAEMLRAFTQLQKEQQKLTTQREMDEQRIQQAQSRTNAQQLQQEEKLAQAQNKTATQRAVNEEKIRQEQQKTATEAEKQAMDVLKSNEKVRQEKEKTRAEAQKASQEEQKAAQQEAKANRENVKVDEEKVRLVKMLYELQQRVNRDREREANATRKAAEQEQKQKEEARQRAEIEAKITREKERQATVSGAVSGFRSASGGAASAGRRYTSVGNVFLEAGKITNYLSQGFDSLQRTASQFTNNIWSYAQRIGNQIVSQAEKIAQTSLEQYKTLETAQIGFGNFFNGSPAEFTRQVRQHAQNMPGVGAQDLVRGIQYIAPLAGGNSDLALNAAEGVMKAILYSGNDVSAYGTNALQNLQQLASGNFTYADIRQMLRAMPTLPSLLANNETGKQLLDNGAITTDKLKKFIKENGQSALLELFAELSENSPAADIYDKYRKTLSGIIEETGETIKNSWNDAMENAGVYRTVVNTLQKILDSKAIQQFFNKIGDMVARVVNFFNHEDTAKNLEEWLKTAKEVFRQTKLVVKDTLKGIGEALGVLNKNGSLNTAGLRQLTRDISEFLKGLIQGFGGGLKTVIELVKNLAKSLGSDGFRKLGQFLGTLASPLGQLIGLITKLSSTSLTAAGSLFKGLGGLFTTLSKLSASGGDKVASKLMSLLGATPTGSAISNAATTAASGVGQKLLMSQNPVALLPAGNLTASSKLANAGAKASSVMNSAKVAVASGIGKITNFAVNLLRGGMVAGISLAAGQLINSFLDVTGVAGEATNGIKKFVSGLSAGVAGFAILFSVTKSPIAGALGGLVTGIIGYTLEVEKQKQKLQQENNDKMKEEISEQTTQDIDKIAQHIADVYKTAGGQLDIESEEGRTAYDDLKNFITNKVVKYDENGKVKALHYEEFLDQNGNIDPDKFNELFDVLANDLYQQKMNSAMIDFTESSAFDSAMKSGRTIDWDKDTDLRQRMYDLIVRNALNGTDAAKGGEYDYGQSQEKVIKDYLDGKKFTTGALDALEGQEKVLGEQIKPGVLDVKSTVAEIDDKLATDVDPNLAKVANATETFEIILRGISNRVMQIAMKNNANFNTFGFNGVQLGGISGAQVDKVYSDWKTAQNKGTGESFGSLYVRGNEFYGGFSVKRNSEGFQKIQNAMMTVGGTALVGNHIGENGQLVWDENNDYANNWKTLTTREKAARAYGKNPDSNDDWQESYQKLMDAYNDTLTQQLAADPNSERYKTLQNEVSFIQGYAEMLSAVSAGDWVTLFEVQKKIQKGTEHYYHPITFRASGGLITPVFRAGGGRGVDNVPAYLQPGEFVVRKRAVAQAGLGVMEAINRGDLGAAAQSLGSRFVNSWNNSRSVSSTVNNNQKTVTNNMFFGRRTRAGRLNQYYSLANGMAAGY